MHLFLKCKMKIIIYDILNRCSWILINSYVKLFFLGTSENLNQIVKHLLIMVNLINSLLFLAIFLLIIYYEV